MKKMLLAVSIAAAVLASAVLISQAHADSPKAVVVTLSCDNGPFPSFETTLPPLGEAVTIIGSTSNYIPVMLSYTDASGTMPPVVVHNSHADPKAQPLVTCHSVGPVTGNLFTFVGFFTPVG